MARPARQRPAVGFLLAVTTASSIGGCHPTLDAPFAAADGAIDAEDRRLDHGYALLLDLLADEMKVADVLAIKSPSEATATVLRDIAAAAKDGEADLRLLLEDPPRISTDVDGLPIIETDARNRIANRETIGLLLAGGETFERRILLTQDKACGYLSALAASLATADPSPARRDLLEALAAGFDRLAARIRSRIAVAPAASTTG
jgi:hypothetical protein